MPEETDSDFSGHIQLVILAAWREVEGAEDTTQELEELESADSQHLISAAVEHACDQSWPQAP
eukprot:8720104-Pyramimonas_sp.AAC.1